MKQLSSNVQRRETAKVTNDMQKRIVKYKVTLLEHFTKKPKTD